MPSKKFARVDRQRCVACGACMKVCPKGAVAVYRGCYAKVDEGVCVGCGKCAKTCPADCIQVLEREAVK
ncbi:MAG: 4Fe-4S binding protein [Eubacteriales bacterium]|nr:4Fe-4S binding protein [Eubacteriales bacterium]